MATTYELIASATASSTVASITLTSIPQTYEDLLIKVLHSGTTTGNAFITYNFNSDTAANYINGRAYGNGGLFGPTWDFSNSTSAHGGDFHLGAYNEIYIPRYSTATNRQTAYETGRNLIVAFGGGQWTSASAITSIKVNNDLAFVAGDKIFVYGIKKA